MIHCPEGNFPAVAIGPHEDLLPWSTAPGPLEQPRIADLPGGGDPPGGTPGREPKWRRIPGGSGGGGGTCGFPGAWGIR